MDHSNTSSPLVGDLRPVLALVGVAHHDRRVHFLSSAEETWSGRRSSVMETVVCMDGRALSTSTRFLHWQALFLHMAKRLIGKGHLQRYRTPQALVQ